MTRSLETETEALLAEIDQHPANRHLLQPRLHELIAEMGRAGLAVPARLSALDARLGDEGAEAMFDNLPV